VKDPKCRDCRNPPADGRARCAVCAEKNRLRTREHYKTQKMTMRWTR
jgi:hypothetical protein